MRYANIYICFFVLHLVFFSSLVPASVLSSWGSIPQLGNKKMYSEVIKIMHEYGYMM